MAKAKPKFSVSIQLGEQVLEGSGANALEALKSIKKPAKIFTKSVVTISDGKRTKSYAYPIPRTKRLFYPLAQNVLAKQFDLLLK